MAGPQPHSWQKKKYVGRGGKKDPGRESGGMLTNRTGHVVCQKGGLPQGREVLRESDTPKSNVPNDPSTESGGLNNGPSRSCPGLKKIQKEEGKRKKKVIGRSSGSVGQGRVRFGLVLRPWRRKRSIEKEKSTESQKGTPQRENNLDTSGLTNPSKSDSWEKAQKGGTQVSSSGTLQGFGPQKGFSAERETQGDRSGNWGGRMGGECSRKRGSRRRGREGHQTVSPRLVKESQKEGKGGGDRRKGGGRYKVSF